MMVVVCWNCLLCLRVLAGDLEEICHLVGEKSEYWPDKYFCPSCGGPATGGREEEVPPSTLAALKGIHDLSAQELFAALNGLGLPYEYDCTLEKVEEALLQHAVVRVFGAGVPGTERCVLECLELSNGQRIYLGASPHGAVVYRNKPEQSYTKKVLEEGVR